MRTWVYSYIRTSDGDIIPWLERVEYYEPPTTTETVYTLNLYRLFPSLQTELTQVIRKCRLAVKNKKTLRDALQLGVYLVGERIFAVVDIDTAYEVTNGKLTTLTREDYQKYIKHEHFISTPQEFASLPEEILGILLELFKEVAKDEVILTHKENADGHASNTESSG
jgi:hypothetical protein